MVAWVPVVDAPDLLAAVAAGSDASRAYEPYIDVDCARLARQVRHSGRTTIGLLPTGRDIADDRDTSLHAFTCELAFAIGVLAHTATVVFDPEQASGVPSDADRATFHVHVPAPNVAVLAPAARAPAGARFEVIRLMAQWIAPARDAIGHVLVDLRGCRLPGELLGATHLLDGIMLVGRSGRVDERDLARSSRMVPPHLDLGVVLTTEAK